MTFGDDTFMALASAPDTEYDALYPIVDAAIRPKIAKRLYGRSELYEELVQDIHLAVWQNLPRFLARASTYTPQQRLAWLHTIVSNKLADLFRSICTGERCMTELSATIPAPAGDPEEQLVQRLTRQEERARVDALLRTACSLRSRPETKIAFLYNRVIMPLERDHAKKGDACGVLSRLENRPLGDIRSSLEQDLSRALGRSVPSEALAGLNKSLRGHEDEPFHLSSRQIATASHSICAALNTKLIPFADSVEEAHRSSKKAFFADLWASSLFHHAQQRSQSIVLRDALPHSSVPIRTQLPYGIMRCSGGRGLRIVPDR